MVTVGMNYHVIEGKQQDFEEKFAAVITALIMMAVAALAMTGTITAMLRGVDQVRAALDEISAGGGDLTQRLPVAGKDEVARIAASSMGPNHLWEDLGLPSRAALGLPEDAFVLCSFNKSYKFNPAVFDSWARILKQIDNAKTAIARQFLAVTDKTTLR